MKQIKSIIVGVFIGAVLGLWFGVNIGKDRPLVSNPFAETKIKQQIKTMGDKLIEKSG